MVRNVRRKSIDFEFRFNNIDSVFHFPDTVSSSSRLCITMPYVMSSIHRNFCFFSFTCSTIEHDEEKPKKVLTKGDDRFEFYYFNSYHFQENVYKKTLVRYILENKLYNFQ